MPKSNSQQKSTPDDHTRHRQVGAKRRGEAALLRVRTRPECPEGNLSTLTRDTNLNHGIVGKALTEDTAGPFAEQRKD